jgi:hypothetical protein
MSDVLALHATDQPDPEESEGPCSNSAMSIVCNPD